jgi:hypothetical protein
LTVVDRLNFIERHPALRTTATRHRAAIVAAGQDLMSRSAGRTDAATEAFKRE